MTGSACFFIQKIKIRIEHLIYRKSPIVWIKIQWIADKNFLNIVTPVVPRGSTLLKVFERSLGNVRLYNAVSCVSLAGTTIYFVSFFCSFNWIFYAFRSPRSSLHGDGKLFSSKTNIHIILYLMMVLIIYMAAPFSLASRFCRYCRIQSNVAFLISLEYPPVLLRASIRFPNSTSFLQYHLCCWSVLFSAKCFRHFVQKCFFRCHL